MNNFFYGLWIVSRPKTLFASISPVLIGLAYAIQNGNQLNYLVAAITLLTAVLLQILANIANDLFDHLKGIDTSKRVGPIRAANSKLLTLHQFYLVISVNIILIICGGIFLTMHGGIPILIIGLFSIIFAFLYSVGPYPLSHHALGEVAALVFFGIIPVAGTNYLQTGVIEKNIFILGFIPGLFAAIIMGINNLRDILHDQNAHKITIATLLKPDGMYYFLGICLLAILFLTNFFILKFNYHNTFFFLNIILMIHLLLLKNILFSHNASKLNKFLAKTALAEFSYAVLFLILAI